jgi:hypothetical protein
MSTIRLWFPPSVLQGQCLNRALFLAFDSVYSITTGAYVSFFQAALAEQFGVRNFASINGLLYMNRGIGMLIETSAARSLIHRHSGPSSYPASSFERTSLLVGCLLVGASMAVSWQGSKPARSPLWPMEDAATKEQNHSGGFISQLSYCNTLRSGMTIEGCWILIRLCGTESSVCIPPSCCALGWTRCQAGLCRSPSHLTRMVRQSLLRQQTTAADVEPLTR